MIEDYYKWEMGNGKSEMRNKKWETRMRMRMRMKMKNENKVMN